VLRDEVMATARRRSRELAGEGLAASEIEMRLNENLNPVEQDLLRIVIRSDVDSARRRRLADSLELGQDWFRQHSGRGRRAA
jgi:hypothetical protein